MIFYDACDLESQLVELVLKAKQIEYSTQTVVSECAISDNVILIDDPIIAINYLNERHPKPNLFSTSPEQNARLNMFLFAAIEAYKSENYNAIIEDLAPELNDETFILGEKISIIDLIIYPILPDTEQWARYKQKINNTLNK